MLLISCGGTETYFSRRPALSRRRVIPFMAGLPGRGRGPVPPVPPVVPPPARGPTLVAGPLNPHTEL